YAPYLEVTLEEPAAGGPPQAPKAVELVAAHGLSGIESGALKILIRPQGEGDSRGFCYEVAVSGKEMTLDNVESTPLVPRNLLPHIDGSAVDTVILRDLPPRARHYVAVRTVDRCGRRSDRVFARGFSSSALEVPEFAKEDRPSLGGKIRVWACGPCEKVNPVSGRLLEESPGLYTLHGEDGNYDYKYGNYLWDAAASRVTLDLPRGGTAAFHIVVEPEGESLEGISVSASWVDNPGSARSRFPARVFKDWYIRSSATGAWYPEVAVPLKEGQSFSVPDSENKVQGQRNQAVLVEFYVPRVSRPGTYRGRVVVGARGLLSRTIDVRLHVHRAMLPSKLPFITELNAYGPFNSHFGLNPGSDEYFDVERKYYRTAHEHLCVINQLPYTQTGKVNVAGAPVLEGEGESLRVADWSLWDRKWGPYLDGRAFRGTDREVPVPVMYLPFHENWPADLKKNYRFTATDTSYRGMINEHALEAPPIGEAFDPAYKEAFLRVFKEFIEHFRAKGWRETEFHYYLNNKYYWKSTDRGRTGDGCSWWLLDEPYHWDDFKALAFFGRLFMKAAGGVRDLNFLYRLDMSRPHLQFGLFDGIKSVTYSSPMFYEKNMYLRSRMEKYGEEIRNYGRFNNLEDTNLTTTAWPLKVYLNHGSGLLPWQTIGSDRSFESFQNTAVLYPGVRFGIQGPLASLRLKAARLGTENVVLLDMLARRRFWTREQAALAVAEHVSLGGGTETEFFDDAGGISFGSLKPAELSSLRKRLLMSLDK
ncbi:MAG: hypothetical protein U9N45_04195, partial [Gemmatimonadota bacterium]|nr:hypothetical protein [Gemmatimonadota bacterium]